MFKNTADQRLTVFAFNSMTNLPVTGDAANLRAFVTKDNGDPTELADTSAREQDAIDAAGYYDFDLAQEETNANKLQFNAISSTSNVVVIAVPVIVYTEPFRGLPGSESTPDFIPGATYETIGQVQLRIDTMMYTDAWDNASDDQKQRALYSATRDIDSLNYLGTLTDIAQDHAFPRNGDTVIPDAVLQAHAEIALARLNGVNPDEEQETLNLSSQGFANVRNAYFPNTVLDYKRAGIASPTAYNRLRPYLDLSREIKLNRVN